MTSLTTTCPTCGNILDEAPGVVCANCEAPAKAPDRLWGAARGILVWLGSVGLIFGFQIAALIIYLIVKVRETGQIPKTFEIDWLVTVLSLGSTFPAHLLTLVLCWLVVTDSGKRPFFRTLGWSWHPQFKWVHAVGLAFLMLGVALLYERFLPHRETDMEKLLKMGTSIRLLVAALAVLTAPIVEEVVYRGVLYAGLERTFERRGFGNARWISIGVVTLLFAGVHGPQYWGSIAAISAILSLSLVLTILRAWTGSLLPCVATHFVYNGIQAVALLFATDKVLEGVSSQTAVVLINLISAL
ncbi:MAG: lysostaphin resistance A-like protein [Blastocatellales bacterium]